MNDDAKPRGFFGVALWRPRFQPNIGAVLRSANIFGASFVSIIGASYSLNPTDTLVTPRHLPVTFYADADAFFLHRPMLTRIVAVELAPVAESLVTFTHPQRAIYLLGPEDGSLPSDVLERCDATVVIPGRYCLNLATAASIAMYDRVAAHLRRSHEAVARSTSSARSSDVQILSHEAPVDD